MRRYDDPIEVRRGAVPGDGVPVEGPEQFLWRGRLWKVRTVQGHWVETGPWWRSREAAGVLGAEEAEARGGTEGGVCVQDLLAEREVWRVEASRGMAGSRGVFDLVLDWAEGKLAAHRLLGLRGSG